MADLEKTVKIIFSGDDQLSSVANKLTGKMNQFGEGVSDIAAPLAAIADNVLKVDAALAALASGGLVYAFSKSKDFEAAQIELKKVVGDQPEVLAAATKAALEMSNKYGEGAGKILLSSANFKQAGYNAQESLQLTKDSLDLVIAGDLAAADSSELLIATLKGFRAPASEAARVVDILNEVSNQYATDVGELARGMAGISPIARQMGFSMEETAGMLTPVIEIFRSGDEAAIALKTGLLKLVDDSKPVQKALKALGVAQTDANGNLRSGRDILFDVAKAFQTADQDAKLFLTQQLVGIQQSARMVEVFDNLSKSTEITRAALNSAGSAAQEVAARLESSETAVDRFKVGFENLAIIIGDQFRDAAKEAINGGTEIELALQNAVDSGAFEPIFSQIERFFDELGRYLSGVAAALPEAMENVDFSGLTDSIGEAWSDISRLFGNLDLTKPQDLARAVQAVVDSVESIIRVTGGMVEAFVPIFDQIRNAITWFNSMDAGTKEFAGNLLGSAKIVDMAGGIIGSSLDMISGALSIFALSKGTKIAEGVKGIGAAFTSLGATLTATPALAAAASGAFGLTAGTLINEYVPGVKEAAQEGWRLIDTVINFTGTQGRGNQMLKEADERLKQAREQYAKTRGEIEKLPAEAKTEVKTIGIEEALEMIRKVPLEVEKIPDKKNVDVILDADGNVLVEIKRKVDEAVPEKKTVKIDAKIETEKIKAQAAIVQSSIEWNAKINVAKVEADVEKVKAMFESVNTTVESTGSTLSSLWGNVGELSGGQKYDLERQIREENERRDKALKLQEKLIDSQTALMNEKKKAISEGKGLITVSADGLEPELQAFMWKILERVQVRAAEENAEFLLGLDN